ncbi:sodium-dependent transporter [Lachnospira eligens]|jgi:Na+-dependent transporters of the SNF family|uniref:sodium-dependent transporter n=1 Tax=Lachnospira eligens TaxID=39485 RepID=UPI0020983AF9|nr:sodium-dependent transporter [Lachnospira eligens]MCO7144296.1 sodium-dependent transporter [Lachnospira eligens]
MKKRDSFNNKWGFILACIGSAVGMGNIWMFPTRVSMYGGGSYLIPYFIFVALIGFTGVIGEMSFGRATKSGPVDAFGYACETKNKRKLGEAIGFIPVLGALAMAIGYTVVMGWILKYMIGAFTGKTLAPADTEGFAASFGSMASAFGNNVWQIVALVIGIIILMFGVGRGIEKANKIMMPVFFILFAVLGIYVAFQPGAIEGYKYIFRVDPEAFADPKTWIFALGQAFFSLSIAGNGTLIYGSYLSDNEDIPAAAGRVALFDTIAAMLAALVIIPAMATTGAQLNQGGPGLMFIFLPALFKSMPGGYIVAIIFFVAVFMAGLSSLINLYEAPIATIQEKLHLGRKASCAIIAAIALIVSICIQGIVSGWMDILSIYICPLGAGLAGIMFFWICGKKYVETQVNTGRDKKFTDKFYPICKYIFCPVCFLVLILGIVLGGIG